MRNFVLFVLLLFVVSAWEILASPVISLAGIKPSLALIVLVYLSVYRGSFPALLFGFFWGIISDSASPELLGWNALIYVMIGYAIGFTKTHFDLGNLFAQLLLIFTAVFIHNTLYFLFFNFSEAGRILYIIGRFSLTSALYSTLLAGILFYILRRGSEKARI